MLKTGSTCGANFVPRILRVMVEEMRLREKALVNDPVPFQRVIYPQLDCSIVGRGTAALRGPSLNITAASGGSPSAAAPGSTAIVGASGPEHELPGASALPLGSAGTSGTISGAAGAGDEYEDETECFGNFAGARQLKTPGL